MGQVETTKFSAVVKKVKDGHLCLTSEYRAMVEFVESLSEPALLKECKAQAAAVLAYLSQRKDDSIEDHNAAVKIKARVEHRLGEVLATTVKHSGGRPRKQCHSGTVIPAELGNGNQRKHTSSRTQQLARISWEKIEEAIDQQTAQNKRASQSRVVKELLKKQQADKGPPTGKANIVHSLEEVIKKGQRFGTIYADPPWKYSNQRTRGATDNHYPTMTIEEIAALPVGEVAADVCHLHLWTTVGFLFECPRLFESWGFEYRSEFIWRKPSMGLGNYWRLNHEILLLAVKGDSQSFAVKNLLSCQEFKRGRHSSKPEQVRRLIEKASPGPYLELFGRLAVKGWTVFGNEVERDMYTTEDLYTAEGA